MNSFQPTLKPIASSLTNFESHWNSEFINSDVIKQWIDGLTKKESKNCRLKAIFLPKSIAEIINVWCQKLKLSQNVFYRTLELYDTFIWLYVSEKARKLQTATGNKTSSAGYLSLATTKCEELKTELKHRCILYLVSCLQIASKLEDSHKVVTVKQAGLLLADISRPCDQSTIVQSEVLVLSVLRFEVDFPPVSDYISFLMCEMVSLLKRDSSSSSKNLLYAVDKVHEASHMIVQSVYLDSLEAKAEIVDALSGVPDSGDTSKQLEQNDERQDQKMVLAAGAISAATFRIQPSWASHAMRHLFAASGVHPSTIAHVSAALHEYIEQGIAAIRHPK